VFKFSKTISFILFVICLFALGAEIYILLTRDFTDSEQIAFELIVITFLLLMLAHLFNNLSIKPNKSKKNSFDF